MTRPTRWARIFRTPRAASPERPLEVDGLRFHVSAGNRPGLFVCHVVGDGGGWFSWAATPLEAVGNALDHADKVALPRARAA